MQNHDFSLLKKANISQREAGRYLFGVTITTVNLWCNGVNAPHRLLQKRVAQVLAAVQDGLADGSLPVPRYARSAQRSAYLQKWLLARNLTL